MPLPLTSQEALQLTASFVFAADRMRSSDGAFQARTVICDIASRVAFLRAHVIAKQEEVVRFRGEEFRPSAFATA